MKRISLLICVALIFSCNTGNTSKGEFIVAGEIKNAPGGKIYLEEVFFNQKQPEVIDTAALVDDKFTLRGVATEEGMYRVRLENGPGYIFINDRSEIPVTIDATGSGLEAADFKSPANRSLQKFLTMLASLQTQLKTMNDSVASLKQSNAGDSLTQLLDKKFMEAAGKYKSFIITYVDTTRSPIIALFALGYTNGIEPALIDKSITGVTKKFPEHAALNEIINQYKVQQSQTQNKDSAPAGPENTMAAEINLPDTEGKPFSLSSLRGKYVLVDFWASWCGPCRQENPNVVAAYNKFKDKNFTILGVSLDREKDDWIRAIKDDGLTWQHVSDLKFWNSEVVPLYNIEGIPYNVLVDPQGKIIASSLRGSDLENKLAEVLK